MTFDRIRALIESDQLLALGEALKALTPAERKEHAADLVAYDRQRRAAGPSREHQPALQIAGAGLLPSPSALVPWLVRNQIWFHRWIREDRGTSVVLDVLRHRDPAWLPDLAARLAARLPTRSMDRRDLMTIVLEFCGDTPPDADGFLLHLLAFDAYREWRPALDPLIPRLLEVDGAGVILAETRDWPPFLVEKADRRVLLDGCLARLQQGGGRETDGFLALHKLLDVTLDEVAGHVRDYLAVLPGARSTAAALAQERLRALDEAGRLDFALLADASRRVFGRTEKKLIRTQLTWLGKHAKSIPDEVVLVAAELFSHESDDLRGQAVKLIAQHQARISEETRAELLAPAERLPADLAAEFGVEAVEEEAFALAPFTPTPWPDPIATLDELTGEARSLFGHNTSYLDPITVERVVEAVVRFAWQDREAVARAFEPIHDRYSWLRYRQESQADLDHPAPDCREMFFAVFAAVSAPAEPLVQMSELESTESDTPAQHFAKRMREIVRGLVRSPRPFLVSTPTETSGLLDSATLLERLAKAEAEGWEPWPHDLRQAFRRLPGDTRPEDFASLGSTAGSLLREWLTGLSVPVTELVERIHEPIGYLSPLPEEKRLLVTLKPGLPEPEKYWQGHNEWEAVLQCWPATLPNRREAVAAHLVPHLAHRCESKGDDGALLPALAEAHGPIGVATHLALAYGLGAEATAGRAHAVDALLILAARDQLDGKALGEVIGRLVEGSYIALNRVTPCLRDVARSGAAQQVWHVLTAALPKAWSHNKVADLIELAVEVAQQVKPDGTVDGLAEVAARRGSSKTVVQAKRLSGVLEG